MSGTAYGFVRADVAVLLDHRCVIRCEQSGGVCLLACHAPGVGALDVRTLDVNRRCRCSAGATRDVTPLEHRQVADGCSSRELHRRWRTSSRELHWRHATAVPLELHRLHATGGTPPPTLGGGVPLGDEKKFC